MSAAPAVPAVLRGRSELGVALLLGVVGAVVLADALSLDAPTTDSDRVGPQAFPIAVAVLLLVCAAGLTVNVLRGGHGQAEEGEDVDLSAPTEWRIVVPLLAVGLAGPDEALTLFSGKGSHGRDGRHIVTGVNDGRIVR